LTDELDLVARAPAGLGALQALEQRLVGLDLSGRSGDGLRLFESRVEDVDLSGSTLRRASMRDVVVDGGTWANVDASNALLHRVEIRGVRLTGAGLVGVSLRDVSFVDCRMDLCSMRFGRLERVRFDQCRMEEIDLYEAKLSSVVFTGCDLANASLAKATFASSELHECNLDGIGNPEQLRGVGMPWPDVLRSAAVLAAAVGVHVVDTD
jgi:uncharacterized protein YjbI with pentapeptide repeats